MNISTQKRTKKSMITTGLICIFMTSSAVLSGCAGASKEQSSTIIGSVLGGVAGAQFGKGNGRTAATLLGAIAGGMIGGNVGRGLDQQDQQRVSQTLETTPSNQKVVWNNPNTKTNYEFTPVTEKYSGNVNGQATQCRDYVMDVFIDGRAQQVNGRACKNSNGQWINAT
ncbi:MAG: glycine zipper 2TM domain-containing protein [Cocleimonas sp.]